MKEMVTQVRVKTQGYYPRNCSKRTFRGRSKERIKEIDVASKSQYQRLQELKEKKYPFVDSEVSVTLHILT